MRKHQRIEVRTPTTTAAMLMDGGHCDCLAPACWMVEKSKKRKPMMGGIKKAGINAKTNMRQNSNKFVVRGAQLEVTTSFSGVTLSTARRSKLQILMKFMLSTFLSCDVRVTSSLTSASWICSQQPTMCCRVKLQPAIGCLLVLLCVWIEPFVT